PQAMAATTHGDRPARGLAALFAGAPVGELRVLRGCVSPGERCKAMQAPPSRRDYTPAVCRPSASHPPLMHEADRLLPPDTIAPVARPFWARREGRFALVRSI